MGQPSALGLKGRRYQAPVSVSNAVAVDATLACAPDRSFIDQYREDYHVVDDAPLGPVEAPDQVAEETWKS